jgi:hypothetical protein
VVEHLPPNTEALRLNSSATGEKKLKHCANNTFENNILNELLIESQIKC